MTLFKREGVDKVPSELFVLFKQLYFAFGRKNLIREQNLALKTLSNSFQLFLKIRCGEGGHGRVPKKKKVSSIT